MFIVNAALNDISSIGTAGLVALLGYAVVFVGLIALMAVVLVMGKIMVAKKAKTAAAAPAPAAPAPAAPAAAPAPKAAPVLAAGTAGECKFYNVGDREAAMLMAIVANKLGKPLNTLRFKSMKEVI